MSNKEHIDQQVLGLSLVVLNDNINGLICEIQQTIKKSETPEWKEQLECSLMLMQEIRGKVSEAMIVVDGLEREPIVEEKFFNWLRSTFRKVVHHNYQ